jgi:hypothetical protein
MDRVILNILLWTVIIHIRDNNPYPFMLLTNLIMAGLIIFHTIESADICENIYKISLIVILYIFSILLILEYVIQSGFAIINTLNILQNNLYSNNLYSNNLHSNKLSFDFIY